MARVTFENVTADLDNVAEDSFAGDGEDPFVEVKALIKDLTNRMQSECPSEGEHKSRRDDESLKAGDEEVDLETRVAVYSCRVEAAVLTSSVSDSEVAELQVDLGTSSAQQLSMDMRRDDELKIFTTARGSRSG